MTSELGGTVTVVACSPPCVRSVMNRRSSKDRRRVYFLRQSRRAVLHCCERGCRSGGVVPERQIAQTVKQLEAFTLADKVYSAVEQVAGNSESPSDPIAAGSGSDDARRFRAPFILASRLRLLLVWAIENS